MLGEEEEDTHTYISDLHTSVCSDPNKRITLATNNEKYVGLAL